MNHAAFNDLLERVVRESGAVGWTKRHLRRELENHVWEAVRSLQEEGIPEEEIPAMVIQRFGEPEIIGKQLASMHGFTRTILKVAIPVVSLFVAFVVLYPLDGSEAYTRYYRAIREQYLDLGWYERAVELKADAPGCVYSTDGISNQDIPAGNILSFCHSKWLVMKLLPPIQIAGPRVEQSDVLHVMRSEGGLLSVDAALTEQDVEGQAVATLRAFLTSLRIAGGNAREDGTGVYEYPLDPIRILRTVDAAEMWEGDLAALMQKNPDIDATVKGLIWAAACERQLYCYDAGEVVVRSVDTLEDRMVVTLDVNLASGDSEIDSKTFTYEVTRFEDGYANDWSDDRWRVTDGYAYRE